MALQVTGSIGDQRKRNRVRFGKSVFGETSHLPEYLLGKFRFDSILLHAGFKFL